jgi:tetratricopeptide (TPR) repeat protein
VKLHPFVAPGRRQLFVDRFLEASRTQGSKPRCPPLEVPRDLGLTSADLASKMDVAGLAAWRSGCGALAAGRASEALVAFERLAMEAPQARLYPLSSVLALVALRRFDDAEVRLLSVRADWDDDARWVVASALLGTARGDLARAAEVLGGAAEVATDPAVAERYFHVLVWNGRLAEARDYAVRKHEKRPADAAWLERAGDASFLLRDVTEAAAQYDAALRRSPRSASILLKLADVAFLQGDAAGERRLRERFYGRVSR